MVSAETRQDGGFRVVFRDPILALGWTMVSNYFIDRYVNKVVAIGGRKFKFTPTICWLYVILCTYTRKVGDVWKNEVYPSASALAGRLNVTERVIWQGLNVLIAAGLITKEKRWDPRTGGTDTNVYVIEPLAQVDGDELRIRRGMIENSGGDDRKFTPLIHDHDNIQDHEKKTYMEKTTTLQHAHACETAASESRATEEVVASPPIRTEREDPGQELPSEKVLDGKKDLTGNKGFYTGLNEVKKIDSLPVGKREIGDKVQPPAIFENLVKIGVTERVARDLALKYPQAVIQDQITALPFRGAKDPAAMLVKAVKESWSMPKALSRERVRAEDVARDIVKKKQKELEGHLVAQEMVKMGAEEREALQREAEERIAREGSFFAGRSAPAILVEGYMQLILSERLGLASKDGAGAVGEEMRERVSR